MEKTPDGKPSIASRIKGIALSHGFSACGIAAALPATDEAKYLDRWIAEGCNAGMDYMANHRELRLDPSKLLPGARSVISLALNYYPPVRRPEDEPHIAYYAYGKDYHVVMKKKLRTLWQAILPLHEGEKEPESRFFTDSAPVLERYWAWRAGLGWIGRNTCLIIPGRGSFFFLGEIITTWIIDEYDKPQASRCGLCTKCVDACPTGALSSHKIDARHCLSYLTIEHHGDFPPREANLLGNRLYGCDTCQLSCPWNRFATPTGEKAFMPSEAFLSLKKEELPALSRDEYNRIFAGSAARRAKYEGFMRTIKYLNNKT